MKVYHGTTKRIKDKFLVPHIAFEGRGYGEWVHFATSYEIALLYATNPIRAFYYEQVDPINIPSFSSHLDLTKRIPKIYELYENMFVDLYNLPVYIYECDLDKSELSSPFGNDYERVIDHKVEYCKIYEIPNLLRELMVFHKNNRIEMVSFDRVIKIHDFYCDYLYDKVELLSTTWEADFYYKKFSNNPEIIRRIPEKFKHK